jgi:hypothetical protein
MATPKTPGRKATRASTPKNGETLATDPRTVEVTLPPAATDTTPETNADTDAAPKVDAPGAERVSGPVSDPTPGPVAEPARTSDDTPASDAPPPEPAQDQPDSASRDIAEPESRDSHAEQAEAAAKSPAEPSAPPAQPAPARSGGGVFVLLMGGVAAAVLGFVMARYVLPEGWPVPGASPLQAQIERQATEIEALRDQLANATTAPDFTPLEAQIATLRDELALVRDAAEAARHAAATAVNTPATVPDDLIDRLDQLAARIDTLEARPAQPEGVAAVEDITGLEAAIADLREGLAAQEARTAEAAAAARAEVERMQTEAEAARKETETEAASTLQRAALSQIEAALLNGTPYGEPLAVLAGTGQDIAAVLTDNAESGLPTLASLADGFDEPARAAIGAELRSDMGESLGDRIGSFLRAQTGARSLSPRDGTDADAVLSRAEAALRADDLDRALAELAALSEPAQTEMAGWMLQAERHRDAASALAALVAAVTER